jgi:hypothetical protein
MQTMRSMEAGRTAAAATREADHLLFEWVLSFSGWTYVTLAASETFEALVPGLQGAVWTLRPCRRSAATWIDTSASIVTNRL